MYGRQTKVWVYMIGAGVVLMAVSLVSATRLVCSTNQTLQQWAISGKGGTPVPGVQGCHIANSLAMFVFFPMGSPLC
jgi:hypothetical protein